MPGVRRHEIVCEDQYGEAEIIDGLLVAHVFLLCLTDADPLSSGDRVVTWKYSDRSDE